MFNIHCPLYEKQCGQLVWESTREFSEINLINTHLYVKVRLAIFLECNIFLFKAFFGLWSYSNVWKYAAAQVISSYLFICIWLL